MTEKVKIREIFKSIQGEGPYVGTLQIFVRFCGCNLKCAYCDTDFEFSKSKDYTVQELLDEIAAFNLPNTSAISLTGGEPLLSADFLTEFLPLAKRKGYKIYLETNALLPAALEKVLPFIDVVSADIKLKSSTGIKSDRTALDRFLNLSKDKDTFVKIVFDKNITDEEINFAAEIAQKYNIEIILQPMMDGERMSVSAEFCEYVFDKFYSKYSKIRLIPQVHKFLQVR